MAPLPEPMSNTDLCEAIDNAADIVVMLEFQSAPDGAVQLGIEHWKDLMAIQTGRACLVSLPEKK